MDEKLDQVLAELAAVRRDIARVNTRLDRLRDVVMSVFRIGHGVAAALKGEIQSASNNAKELFRNDW